MKPDLLIVGAGPMARFHAFAAAELGCGVWAVCRSEAAAQAFSAETGIPVRSGGLALWLTREAAPDRAVVAVGVDQLAAVTNALLEAGTRRILVEKPAGIDAGEITALAARSAAVGADVAIGYNRRFYESVRRAAALIAEDGGATSLRFDFTERADIVGAGKQPDLVKRNWFLANSTHVIDLAFHLAGEPATLAATVLGGLPWHPAGSRFVGHGVTAAGAAFSYHADWDAPGRWSVDVRTRKRRLVLEPLEQLRVQVFGSFDLAAVEPREAAQQPGRSPHKPGILAQMAAFLGDDPARALVAMDAHARRVRDVYEPMLQGTATG